MLVGLVTFVLLATSATAVSFTDADGDGICEPSEEITFTGDDVYTDEFGLEHDYTAWEWDFDNDGEYDDASGKVVKFTFPEEGSYTVRVLQSNGDYKEITITVEVKNENNSEPKSIDDDPKDDAKIKKLIMNLLRKLIRKHPRIYLLMKLLLRYLEKKYDIDPDDIDWDYYKEYIMKIIKHRYRHCYSRNRCRC